MAADDSAVMLIDMAKESGPKREKTIAVSKERGYSLSLPLLTKLTISVAVHST